MTDVAEVEPRAAVPPALAYVASDQPIASVWGNQVADLVNLQRNPPGCRARATAVQSLTAGVETPILLPAEDFDTDTMHDLTTNTSRLTIKTAGVYVVAGFLGFDGGPSGQRQAFIKKNGTLEYLAMNAPGVTTTVGAYLPVTAIAKFAVNDWVELMAFVTGGTVPTFASPGQGIVSCLSAAWQGTG